MILERLRAIGGGIYEVGHRVLDTAEHGLPQHRERVFIIGIRRRNSHRKGRPEFRWPRPVACRPLARSLDPLPVGSDIRQAERNFLATVPPDKRNVFCKHSCKWKQPGWTASAMKSSLLWTWMAPRLAGCKTYLRA